MANDIRRIKACMAAGAVISLVGLPAAYQMATGHVYPINGSEAMTGAFLGALFALYLDGLDSEIANSEIARFSFTNSDLVPYAR